MIIVTVLRDKLIHSETIRDNQSNQIRSDRSNDFWQDMGSTQFQLSQQLEMDNRYIFLKWINDITTFHLFYWQYGEK